MKTRFAFSFTVLTTAAILLASSSARAANSSSADDDFTIHPGNGFGSVKLGMDRKQLDESLGKRDGSYWLSRGLKVEYSQWKEPGKVSVVRAYIDRRGKVIQLSCEEAGPKLKAEAPQVKLVTGDGVTLGTPSSEALKKYSGLKKVNAKSKCVEFYDDTKSGIAFEVTKEPFGSGATSRVYAIIVHAPGKPVIVDTDSRPVTTSP